MNIVSKRILMAVAGISLLSLMYCGLLSAPVFANTTSYWTQAGLMKFYEGKLDGTALTDDGKIVLGINVDKISETPEQFLWSIIYDGEGNLWAGSGNKSILYKIKDKGDPIEAAVLPGVGISALAVDSKNNIYAASFPGGTIYRIEPGGARTEFATVPAMYVWDMEFDKDGNLYCVTGLMAAAFKITPAKEVVNLYTSTEKHFLSMFLDGAGNLYTGTSPSGLILKINLKVAEKMSGMPMMPPTAKGTAKVHFGGTGSLSLTGPKKLHIEVIGQKTPDASDAGAVDETGADIAKPDDSENKETEVAPDPRVTVLLDMSEDEAYRLLPLKDGRFLVAMNQNQTAMASQPGQKPMPRIEPLSFPIGQTFSTPDKVTLPSKLYIVTPEGKSKLALELPDPYIMALHLINDDTALIGTGNDGRFYTFNVKTEKAALQNMPVKQILAITGSGDKLRVATGNPGAVFAPSLKRADKGTYTSTINDAYTTAAYGYLTAVYSLPDKAGIDFSTRSGNTPNPTDGTWGAWSDPALKPPFKVKSANGRYIQYKAGFKPSPTGDSPELTETRIYYITDNQPPEIQQFQVLPQPDQRPAPSQNQAGNRPAQAAQAVPSQGPKPPQPGQPSPERNLVVGTVRVSNEVTFRWIAQDPDTDSLKSKIEFRRLPSSAWVTLDDKIYASEYHWTIDSMMDGAYEARLTVTDEEANTPARALSAEMLSDPFVIDHTRPDIKIQSMKKTGERTFEVKAVVTDPTSAVSSAEYSLNDLKWRMAFPEDLIFDSTSETVVFTVEIPEGGSNTLLIRANDFVGNTGSMSAELK